MHPAKRRILCVDDDEDTCFMLTHLLKQENYETKTARTISEALEMARSESFNLYILDEWFPREAGVGLCRKIREVDPHTPDRKSTRLNSSHSQSSYAVFYLKT